MRIGRRGEVTISMLLVFMLLFSTFATSLWISREMWGTSRFKGAVDAAALSAGATMARGADLYITVQATRFFCMLGGLVCSLVGLILRFVPQVYATTQSLIKILKTSSNLMGRVAKALPLMYVVKAEIDAYQAYGDNLAVGGTEDSSGVIVVPQLIIDLLTGIDPTTGEEREEQDTVSLDDAMNPLVFREGVTVVGFRSLSALGRAAAVAAQGTGGAAKTSTEWLVVQSAVRGRQKEGLSILDAERVDSMVGGWDGSDKTKDPPQDEASPKSEGNIETAEKQLQGRWDRTRSIAEKFLSLIQKDFGQTTGGVFSLTGSTASLAGVISAYEETVKARTSELRAKQASLKEGENLSDAEAKDLEEGDDLLKELQIREQRARSDELRNLVAQVEKTLADLIDCLFKAKEPQSSEFDVNSIPSALDMLRRATDATDALVDYLRRSIRISTPSFVSDLGQRVVGGLNDEEDSLEGPLSNPCHDLKTKYGEIVAAMQRLVDAANGASTEIAESFAKAIGMPNLTPENIKALEAFPGGSTLAVLLGDDSLWNKFKKLVGEDGIKADWDKLKDMLEGKGSLVTYYSAELRIPDALQSAIVLANPTPDDVSKALDTGIDKGIDFVLKQVLPSGTADRALSGELNYPDDPFGNDLGQVAMDAVASAALSLITGGPVGAVISVILEVLTQAVVVPLIRDKVTFVLKEVKNGAMDLVKGNSKLMEVWTKANNAIDGLNRILETPLRLIGMANTLFITEVTTDRALGRHLGDEGVEYGPAYA